MPYKKRVKLKQFRYKRDSVLFGIYGLKALMPLEVTKKQVEALRRVISRKTLRKSRVWVRIEYDKMVTSKGGTRMGKGKGNFVELRGHVYIGQVFFEFTNIKKDLLEFLFKKIFKKIWFNVKIVKKH